MLLNGRENTDRQRLMLIDFEYSSYSYRSVIFIVTFIPHVSSHAQSEKAYAAKFQENSLVWLTTRCLKGIKF